MKKNKFILAAAFAAALVSCSQDENLNSSNDYTELINSGQIAFATANASKADTRAGETLTALSNFYVTAVNNSNAYYFKEQQFNKEGSVFTSATKFYWPTTGTLSFYAVNYKGTINSTAAVPTYNYTEWDGSKDLVAATVKASEKQIPCPLTFKHLTAKVGYSAKAKDQTEELNYTLYAVRMTTPAKGTYTFANASEGTGTWSIDNNTTKTYDFGLPASGVTFNQTGSNASGNTTFNVLPVTDGNITFEVEYKVLKNGNVISDFTGDNKKTVTVNAPNLTPGKKYVYNFLLTRGTDETITFSTTVSEWDNNENSTDIELFTPAESKAIDLGLPSGLKWAAGNLGADKETDPGLYYMWGDTEGHAKDSGYNFLGSNYTSKGLDAIETNLTLAQDAANVRLGGSWRMPTKAEFEELYNNTNVTWTTIDGVAGRKFANKTDASKYIFMPAAGYYAGDALNDYDGSSLYNWGSLGSYWSSTFSNSSYAYRFGFGAVNQTMNDIYRYHGYSVRGVLE